MVNVIIILVLIVILVFATKSSIRHFKGEGACCGGSGTVKRPKPKRKKLSGPVTGHCTIKIAGMHCQNCVDSVTRAINAIDGAAAKVSLKRHTAEVSCDRYVEKEKLKDAVEEAGFEVVSID